MSSHIRDYRQDRGDGKRAIRGDNPSMTATYIPFSIQDHPAASWEIDVPNGTYRVWVLVGDPINSSRTYLTCNSEVIFDEHNQQIIQVGLRQRSVRIEVNRGKIKFQSKPASDQKEITRILACTIMDEKLIRVDPDLLSDLAIVNAKHLSSKQRNLFAVRRRLELQLQRLEQAASGLLSVDAGTQVESKSVLEGLNKQREEIQPKLVEIDTALAAEAAKQKAPRFSEAVANCKPTLIKRGCRVKVVDIVSDS